LRHVKKKQLTAKRKVTKEKKENIISIVGIVAIRIDINHSRTHNHQPSTPARDPQNQKRNNRVMSDE
jgi:hypothetical protein